MDKKAKQILFKKFWSRAGWTDDKKISENDFEHAKTMGLMFDPVNISHEGLGKSIKDRFQQIDKKQIVNGFIASLSTRNLRHRSFLSSYAFSKVLKEHVYISSNGRFCDACGIYGEKLEEIDLNILNFEKLKWGGVRLMHLDYVNFDLGQALMIDPIEPIETDFEILNNIKEVILSAAETDRPRQLEKKLTKVFKSNAEEREVILNIFGICGILETEDQVGFLNRYVPTHDRELRPISRMEWSYPVDWWQGKFGLNERAWKYYFE